MQEITSQKIIINNSTADIQSAILSLENFAHVHGIPITTIDRVNAAISELLANIVQYSFPKNKQGEIGITLQLFDTGKLAIKLINKGIPFNPFYTSPPKYNNASKYKNMDSLGLHLVRKCMDEYNYKRIVDYNITWMSKEQI